MAKKNSPYFEDFITMINLSCDAAEFLQKVLKEFKPETLHDQRKKMHDIEHTADKVKHAMMQRLVKEFVVPIEREDIIHLSSKLDDLTDKIDDILTRMYMYNIKSVFPGTMDFADVILSGCKALQTALTEFPNFQKSTKLRQLIIDVNTLEEKGDKIYIDATRKLYETGGDPVDIAAWSELFDRLEDCCDACEDVADAMEIIMMKNS